jgi:DUF4097 and DUF4098 domain-containing protein YvlB
VPTSTRLRLHAANGNIRASNLAGTLVLSTTNGTVLARNVSGGVDAQTTSGTVTLDLAAAGTAPVAARATNGSLTVTLPSEARVSLEATCTSGSIDAAALALTPDGSQSACHVRGSVNGGGAPLSLATTHGDIQLRTRAGARP